jgi:hypothetical protein
MTQEERNDIAAKLIPIITTLLIPSPSPTIISHNGFDYGTVTSPYTNKVWLDRNLGASRVCTSLDDASCYGDYYQWGRNFDGHQSSSSSVTSTYATNVNSAGNSFISSPGSPYDWAPIDSDGSLRVANWSKTDGTSVCPVNYRVPTIEELRAETDNGVFNGATAFSSFLKLPSAGLRSWYSSSSYDVDYSLSGLWTNSVAGAFSYIEFFTISDYQPRAYGCSVRCLRD